VSVSTLYSSQRAIHQATSVMGKTSGMVSKSKGLLAGGLLLSLIGGYVVWDGHGELKRCVSTAKSGEAPKTS
jgi:hypothetical protein